MQHWSNVPLLKTPYYAKTMKTLLQSAMKRVTKIRWKRTIHSYRHTHPFNGPLSGTTHQVSRYQKVKPMWILLHHHHHIFVYLKVDKRNSNAARDSEWQWHQLGSMQVCTLLQTDTMPAPHHSVLYRLDALPAAQPTASKH